MKARIELSAGVALLIAVLVPLPAYSLSISQEAYIKASDTQSDANFCAAGISGDTIVACAFGVGEVYVFVRNGTTWSEQAILPVSGDRAAISGDTIVVGATGDDSNATGVNGDPNNTSAPNSGAAYVFVRNGTTWTQQAYLKASNTDSGDQFGGWVEIDGDTIVVGAIGESSNSDGVNGNQTDNSAQFAGAAYVFVRNGTNWTQQAYLKASNSDMLDSFGVPLAISGDTIVVGAELESSAATGVNGDQSDNSAAQSGAAYVFVRSGSTWTQQAYLKASNTDAGDGFGNVHISGETIVVGAAHESSAATGVNGNQNDNSAANSGAAYVFVRSGTNWTQQAYLKASNTDAGDIFNGGDISGDIIVAGSYRESSSATGVNGNQSDNSATNSGAAYVFVRSGTNWTQQAYLKASNTDAGDWFAGGLLSGGTVVCAAIYEASNATGVNGDQNDNSLPGAGAIYVFTISGTNGTPSLVCSLAPTVATNTVGAAHTVTATVTSNSSPIASASVTFSVLAGGPNAGAGAVKSTSVSGTASFTYSGTGGIGTDTIRAIATKGSLSVTSTATKVWIAAAPNQSPVAVCQNVTIAAGANCSNSVAASAFNSGSSDPDGDPLTFAIAPPGPFARGIHQVVLTVSDNHGASATCTTLVTVVDQTGPTLVCSNLTVTLRDGQPDVVVNFPAAVSDNCGLISVDCVPASGTAFGVGTTPVTCTAIDVAGNTNTCNFNVTVTAQPHDIAVVKLKAPKKATFSATVTNVTGSIAVSLQNLGPVTETIPDAATLASWVTVTVDSLGACPDVTPQLLPPAIAFPFALAPKKKLTLTYTATFNCVNDPAAIDKLTKTHADYRITVTVNRPGDTVPANNDCPRAANPATGDKGCNKGIDALTDVIVK